MRGKLALWCLVLILAFCPVASAANVSVAVRLDAQVRGPHLCLGEIAEVTGENPARVRQLRELQLGDAPVPGATWHLTPALLEPKLLASQIDLSGIDWSVPANFKITTLSQRVSGKQLSDIAQEHLRRVSVGASLSLVDAPADLLAPVGRLELSPDLAGPVRYHQPTTVMVSVRADGVGFAKIPVQFEVKRYLAVVVAAASLNAGDIVAAQSVRLETLDVGRLQAGYLTDLDKVIGLQLRYAVAPGTVLSERSLMRPLLVRRGDSIRLIAKVNGLEVAAMGVALSQGAAGDIVKVQNTATKKILNGRVQEDKSVLVLNQQGG